MRRAHDWRIETVYQEKSLGEKQPLWRFFVGRQITRLGFIDGDAKADHQRRAQESDRLSRRWHRRGQSGARSFRAASGRASPSAGRAPDADLVVLDEPTVALAISEVQKVLDFVRSIKARGRAVYIEHNLAHVHELADKLVILDRGEVAIFGKGEISLSDRFLLDLQQEKAASAA